MKRKNKTVLILLIVIAIPLFCFVLAPLLLYFYGHFSDSEKKVYEINWGIMLPDQMKLVNDKNSTSFHGDGLRHTVYHIKKMENLGEFETEENQEIENFCIETVTDLAVEAKYSPDFTQEYVWKKYVKYDNILVIIYFSDKKELHLFQKLT